ncbi:MAG: glycerol kinase GlpK [Gammaproteobacteria bacterium]|nr:glycerol kinase GlpK [Gammaproteobacteria bacterium]
MSRWILALDQGTTSSRSILFDHDGNIVATAQREFTQHFPQAGWVEHDATEIWTSQLATVEEVLQGAGVQPGDVAAVGITNQRETTVLWDRATGEPIAPAIVWQDRRTADRCATLRAAGHEAEVTRRTGLLLDPYFSGTKLAWLLDHLPGARARAERGELCFGTIDSWLVWKLSGGRHHVTDVTNASRTLLMNLDGEWDEWMLQLLRIPRAVLPRVLPSSCDAGITVTVGGMEMPITGIAGDQQAALFGQACLQPGMAKNTYGTGCFMLMHTGGRPLASQHRLLTTVACTMGGVADQAATKPAMQYALEGSVFVGGAVVQWLRDGLGFVSRASEVEALATSVPDHGGVYVVPAFTGLGSPHWDPFARGSIVGITRGTTRGHIARAALEAIAFQSAELLQAMQQDAAAPLRELRVDGGASRNDFLMQFQADLLGVPVVRPAVTETTALGAAYLAGLASDFWSSTDDIAARWRVDRRFEPSMSREAASARMHEWSRAVERSLGWANG